MLGFKELVKRARKEVVLADHVLHTTYNLVRNDDLLLSALSHSHEGVKNVARAFLTHALINKKLKFVPQDEEVMLEVFYEEQKDLLASNEVGLLKKVEKILRKAPGAMKIKRSDGFMIVSSDYSVLSVNKELVTKHLRLAQELLRRIEGLKVR